MKDVPYKGKLSLRQVCFFDQVDVYSFGVLLCEMCTRQQPDPQELHNQISRVGAAFRGLIQRCVERNPEARPTTGEIISELEKLL